MYENDGVNVYCQFGDPFDKKTKKYSFSCTNFTTWTAYVQFTGSWQLMEYKVNYNTIISKQTETPYFSNM